MLTPEVEISTSASSTDNTDKDAKTLISEYRIKNNNKVVLATLNINLLRNRFTFLMELVLENLDILVIEETKLI